MVARPDIEYSPVNSVGRGGVPPCAMLIWGQQPLGVGPPARAGPGRAPHCYRTNGVEAGRGPWRGRSRPVRLGEPSWARNGRTCAALATALKRGPLPR